MLTDGRMLTAGSYLDDSDSMSGLATLSFVLIHGVFSLIAFPFLFLGGLLYAGIFVWRKSLTPGFYLHALFDVMAVAAI